MSGRAEFQHLVIRASAGTGKTHQLATRFIGLLAAGVRPDEILATTFTRKAAGEILDRVLFRLAEAAGDEAKRRQLAAEIEQPLPAARCRQLLVATVRQLHRLHVGTLDSYFIRVATSFGPELGLPPGWAIGDEQLDAAIRDDAIEQVLARGRLAEPLTLVHSLAKGDTQRSVGRMVRDTVAGLFEMYREALPAAWEALPHVAGLAAEQLAAALDELAAFPLADRRMTTARGEDLQRALAGEWEELICKGLAGKVLCGEGAYHNKPLPLPLVELYQRLLQHAASILVGQIARQTQATRELLSQFAEQYNALQLEQRALRFSDVTFRLAEAAAAMQPQRMAFRMDGGLAHLLLDEFQDTAPPQWRVLRPLATEVTRRSGGSFFCVGDAKQAIYAWRGGEAELFGCLDSELPGLACSELAASYRSAPPVIDAVNTVFQNLGSHPNLDKLAAPVLAWQQAFPSHTTTRKELAGHVTLATAPDAAEGQDAADAVFEFAAEQVERTIEAAPQASVGVLVRTNKAVARMIYLLRKRDIPASEEGGNPLIDSPAVELLLSLLRLTDHPGDGVARFHLANSPLAGPLELADHAEAAAAAEASQQLRRQLLDDGYGKTVFEWARRLAASCDSRDQSRLAQLVELAYDYQQRSTLRTSDFIRLVEQKRIADPTTSQVRVMTIHQAKGLQFDAVFLPELAGRLIGQRESCVAGRPSAAEAFHLVCRQANESVRQFFPPALRELFEQDMRSEVTESLCVLYVAMTRAVHALHMILPPAAANERSLPKTFGGLLRATLALGKPASGGQVLYEHGDAQWWRTLPAPAGAGAVQPESDGTRSVPATIALAPPKARRTKGLERTSPSALEGGTRLLAESVLRPRSAAALGAGTLVHAWLEQVEWLDGGLPADDVFREVAGKLRHEIGDVWNELDPLIARFRQQLAAPAVAAALVRSAYDQFAADEIDVRRERKFAHRVQDELLSGSIDRLVVLQCGGKAIAAEILDFKTDELPAGDKAALKKRSEHYRPQIEAYRAAAAGLLDLDATQIGCKLVFLTLGTVVPIEAREE
jgi:ATP-dependent helicase/nuclease subunit A